MNLPTNVKHALVESMISQCIENEASFRISVEPLTFSIPTITILNCSSDFAINDSDVHATIDANPGSLSFIDDSSSVQLIPPLTRTCELYDELLDTIKADTSIDSKYTVAYDPAIKEGLIYHLFAGSIVMLVPDIMSSLSQLRFALSMGGSKLRAIIDSMEGGWVYVFPKYIMEYMECGKTPARETNVQQLLACYLQDMFSEKV